MKNSYKIAAMAALVSSFVIAGCDSPKDASKDNFKKVINKVESQHCININAIGFSEFPYETSVKVEPYEVKKRNKLDELFKVGVLDRKESTRELKNAFGTVFGKEDTYIYTLTELGKKSVINGEGGFCVGHYSVDDIVNYTEPTDSEWEGGKVSKVNYTKSPIDVVEWVKKLDNNDAFSELKDELSGQQKDKTTVILKNDGWHDVREK